MSKTVAMTFGFVAAVVGATWLVSLGAAEAQDVVKIAAGHPDPGRSQSRVRKWRTVKLAVAQWNEKGGDAGRADRSVRRDNQGDPQVGVTAAERWSPTRR